MNNNLSLSVIMPALNEEKNIKEAIYSTLKAMDHYKIKGEMIVINDGSIDNTGKIIQEIIKNNKNIKLINHNKPMGIGYSFFDGIKFSEKDVVVMFPGDNENDSFDALSFFYLMNNVDIIVPFIHNSEVRNRFRRLISSIYRFIINMSFGINLNYTNGTVFYRKCILEDIKLKSKGFFYQAEILIKLIRKGYMFAEIPNVLLKRNSGKSKAVSFKSLLNIIKNYLILFLDIHIKRIEGKNGYYNLHKKSISIKYK
jgi:glycosyltransferase involved in cell wall biosynthesis